MGLSKLKEKCKNCLFVDRCQNKRMEALAYMTESQVSENVASPNYQNLAAPLLRETVTFMVDGTLTRLYKDEIERQLHSQLFFRNLWVTETGSEILWVKRRDHHGRT